MKNKKVKELIKYNIKRSIRNKWFIAINIIFFIVCLIALNFSEINTLLDSFNNTIIEIKETDELLYENLKEEFLDTEKVEIKRVDKLVYDEDILDKNRILIDISYSKENIIDVKLISKELIENDLYYGIQDAVKETRNEIYIQENNITDATMTEILKEPNIEIVTPDESDVSEEQIDLYFNLMYVLIFTIPFIIGAFSKEIFEEKTSKFSEYILTNITEKDYLISKIFTKLITIVLQGMLIATYYIISCLLKSLITGESLGIIFNVNSDILKMLVIEFILFIPFMLILLIIQMLMGSKASEADSVDSIQTLVMMLDSAAMFIPMFIVACSLENTPFVSYFLSWIPLFSTYLIPALFIFQNMGAIQFVVALIVNIITILILLKIVPKKIKNGILDYKPVNKEAVEKKQKEKIKRDLERKIYIKSFSRYSVVIGLSIILYLVLAMFVLPLLLDPIVYGIFDNKVSVENISLISSIISGILALYIPTKLIEVMNNKKETKVKNKPKFEAFMMAIPFTVLIFWLQTWIMNNIGITNSSSTQTLENTSYFLVFIRLVVVPAIFEEIMFRRAIFNYSKKYGLIFAIIISALMFGVIHLNFYQAIGAGFAGIVFAILAHKTGSLIPSIVLHAMVNGYSFFVSFVFVGNDLVIKLINIFVIAITIIGTIILIENLLKNSKKIKKSLKNLDKNTIKEALSKGNERNVFIFANYYFIISIILTIICFAINQKYMGMLM